LKIGLLSDTHNHKTNLKKALDIFQGEDIKRLFHCGDLTKPSMVKFFRDFQVVYVFGNVDDSREEIAAEWKGLDKGNWCGERYTEQLEECQIVMTHGNVEGEISSLILSGHYKYIFHGHTHHKRDERVGNVRVINPGTTGKPLHGDGCSVCILDITSGEVQFFCLD